ncbi:MAG: GNAT family N-acetyltransferase [Clostridiales bacterium]|jgi:tagatose 1,6-diphosphate aldolase|nr:GNAT family N-acetyltransferase [Clostridiales bacterium]
MVKLIKPCVEYWQDYLRFVHELQINNCLEDDILINAPYKNAISALRLFNNLEDSSRVPEGEVPSSVFWLVGGSRIIGIGGLRHCLNSKLEINGGHIVYAIRPSSRRSGWGAKLMSMMLKAAADRGIKYALVTCGADDIATAKIAKKNGGILMDSPDSAYFLPTGRRFILDTKLAIARWRDEDFRFRMDDIKGRELSLKLTQALPEEKKYCPTYKFAIRLSSTGLVIGYIDLRIGFDEEIYASGNIGYRIESKYRGFRYASKAASMLVPLARIHRMKRLTITCNPNNIASFRTCELIGAKYLELIKLSKDSDQYKQGDRYKRRYCMNI